MREGWWIEARTIEDNRCMRVCGRQRRQVDALGLEWEEADPMEETGSTKVGKVEIIENESLALHTKVYFTNDA